MDENEKLVGENALRNVMENLHTIDTLWQAIQDESTARSTADTAMQALITAAQQSAQQALTAAQNAVNIAYNAFIPDSTTVLEPVTEAVAALSPLPGRYYRFDQDVETLAITLPDAMGETTAKTIVFSFTTGDTPAVTFSSESPVKYFDGYGIEPVTTYEISALWNGAAWVVASIVIAED